MKRKFISLTVCLALLLSLAGISVTVTADEYFSGSGTQADPFLIQTAADLVQLATLTNTSATGTTYAVGKYYKLTADIDMSGVSAYMPISRAIGVGGSHTLPGGTTFKSTFDGDGHVIKNVTMTAQTLAAGGSTYGIIGWLGLDGVIKNLGVENITADGGSTATTLCIGGIVGTIGGGTAQPCAIQNCYVRGMTVTATANGNQFVGGIVGRTVGQKGSIDNCYATELSYTLTNSNYAAGILGGCGNSAHTATNCYTTNSKLQGWATATNSYLATTNCYASDTIASATPANLGAAFKADTNYKNSGYPLLSWESTNVFAGSGTEAEPYLISSSADLRKLARLTNTSGSNTVYTAAGLYYKLTNDIDMSGVASFIPISRATNALSAQFQGGSGSSFKATLDGDGHIIKNVTQTAATLGSYGGSYGIVGFLGAGGVIKNLGVENLTADGGAINRVCIGGIAGAVSGTTDNPFSIQNCYVRGMTVTSTATNGSFPYVGGIVGRTIGQAGTIRDCYAVEQTYTLSTANYAGGILGSSGDVRHTAINCYTTYSKIQGAVSESNSSMTVNNCYNSTTIENATPVNLGLSYINDIDEINSGRPVLVWEYEKRNPNAVKSTVSVNKTGNGSVDFAPSALTITSIPVYAGQGLGFTVTPSDGYVLTKVSYDGRALSVDANGKYTFYVEGNATLTVTFTMPSANDITVYVSNSGNDANDGTQAAPLKTLQAAILATRAVTGNKTVNLADGEYSAESTITLNSSDNNISFCAYQGGEVIFNGGKNIDKSLFSEYSENANILVADLASAGITNFGSIKAVGYGNYANTSDAGYNPVVAIDGEYQIPARYPNSGYISVNSIVTGSTNSENLSFTTSAVDASRWKNETSLGVSGFFGNSWADLSVPATVSNSGIISLNSPSYYGASTAYGKFFVFNALSELDTQGECYIDTTGGKLYIYKPANWSSVKEITFAAGNNILVSVTGADNVTFDGITFENTNANGLRAQNASGLSVLNSVFRNIGRDAMYITSSNNTTISNNTVINIGVTGIRYNNSGSRDTLTSCGTVISGNDISYAGNTVKSSSYAIDITNTVGTLIADNDLHNLPNGAILYNTCNDVIMEYNRIYNTNTATQDSGAVYSGRDWTTRGNIIRYNYFHDIANSLNADVQAIYLDDAHSATTVMYNVFYRVPTVIKIGGGRDNVLRFNLLIDSGNYFSADERLTRTAFSSAYETVKSRYEAVPYTSPAWSKYSHISNIMQDGPTRAKYNNIEYNVRYNTSGYYTHPSDAFLTNGFNNVNNNQTVTNTGFFLDYANGEFAPSATAGSINQTAYNYIKDIPFERMGFAVSNLKINGFELNENAGNLTASIDVKNYSDSVKNFNIIIAQYSGSKLITVASKPVSVASGAAKADSLAVSKAAEASVVKAFLWDQQIVPLCESK